MAMIILYIKYFMFESFKNIIKVGTYFRNIVEIPTI